MAEARSVAVLGDEFTQGTRVALSVDEEGLHFRTDITIPRPGQLIRKLIRWGKRMYRAMSYSFFPFGPALIVSTTSIVVPLVVNAPVDSWMRSGPFADFIWKLGSKFPWIPGATTPLKVGVLAGWTSVASLFVIAATQRFLLKGLLRDKTFLYMARKPTTWLKMWGVMVKALTYKRPLLYSFQSSLPKLPVPPVEQTVKKYLDSAKLLQSPEDFAKTEAQAKDFLTTEGPKLQFYLKLKSWFSPNYVTDWWEKYVYLRGRSPIAINSNYYVLDSGRWTPTHVPEARAASVLYMMMKYCEHLENETIEPLMIQGMIPLCMWQFERMFATSRLPGRECDEIKHWEVANTKHVAVYCKGSYYKVTVYDAKGNIRTPDELEQIFVGIRKDAEARAVSEAEACIPALTGVQRSKWADVRETYFSEGVNRRSLNCIESALIYIVLSDEKFEQGEAGWTPRAKYILGSSRKQADIWFDKSVNLIVTADGKAALNCEHAWADAPVAAHLFEVAMIVGEEKLNSYLPDGHCRPFPRVNTSNNNTSVDDAWSRLQWQLTREAETEVITARDTLHGFIDDLDLTVCAYSAYGKDFVKMCRVSPDAYLQMAMQLAYYRDQGRFDATYESSMTRLFLHGRTETVRPCTAESCNFVMTMQNIDASPIDKLNALHKAAERHELGYKDAMSGKGIDRHLFALYVVSVGKSIDSPFLKGALSVPWRLSTSQQPQQQTTLWDIKAKENVRKISPGGGFGPVADDGYGVSYMVSGETELFFHISCKRSCNNTDSQRFKKNLFGALDEMKEILSLALADQKKAIKNKE